MIAVLMLVGGLALLIFAAGWLVDGASGLARRLGVSDMVIGLTIVAFGTSAPELTINVFSTISGSTGLAIGNILGSNIANILLIVGIASVITPIPVASATRWKEIPLSLLGAIVLAILANDHLINGYQDPNAVSRADGAILLCFLVIFMVYTFEMARNSPPFDQLTPNMPLLKGLGLISVGLIGLYAGGKYMVEGAVSIAAAIGMSERVVGLTVVAIGTSLPELAASVVAALKGKMDIAIGNVVGSNILNIFLVLGVTAFIRPLPFDFHSNLDIGVVILASLLLFLASFTTRKRTIRRHHGVLFMLVYAGYILFLLLAPPDLLITA